MTETAPADDKVIQAVAERLAFFFSNANIRADSFLRRQLLKEDGDKPGHVDVETLLKFNSIKQHTTDPAVVVAAAKTLSEVKVSDDDKAIARVTPFTMKMMDDNIPLSLHVTNIPTKDEKYSPNTMNEIRALFEPYGKVTLVKLRFKRVDGDNGEKKNVAAGGAFVEFETKEELAKAAEDTLTSKGGEVVEAKKKLTVGDNTVEVMTLKEWLDAKRSKHKSPDKNKVEPKKRDREEKEEPKEEVAVEEFTIDWKKGCVIQMKGLAENCDREAIRDAVIKGMGITEDEFKNSNIYVDFSRGQTHGAIRFNEPADTIGALAVKLVNGEVEIAGTKVGSANILEGDDETKYWEDFCAFKTKQMKQRAEDRASRKKRSRH